MYLNTIFYGNGAYGIEAASITYFNKSADDLTLNEAATLVGIPNSPTYYDPFVNYENCKSRRNLVLSRMLEAGDITQEEYDTTCAEEIPLNPGQLTDSDSEYPFFTDYVRNLLLQDFSSDTIAQGGLKVYTTIDPAKQQAAEKACSDRIEAGNNPDIAAALVSIDNSNGYIVAMVGGQNYGNDTEAGESSVNLATSKRQTGSSFKAIVLMAALEQGMSPTVRINCQATLQVTPTWAPSNIQHINYGVITLQRATAVSSNTGYVQVAEAIGMDKVADMAARLGIDNSIDSGLAASLGTSLLTPLEMCEAFSTIATGGVHRNPVAITKIEDRNGNVVYEHEDDPEQVVDSAIAQDATDILETVVSQGSATTLRNYFSADQPVAGKTGTSDNYANLWFCGFTPQLTTAVWVGCPEGGSQRVYYQGTNGTTATTSIPIWGNYMSAALSGEERGKFPKSDHKAEYKPNNSWDFIGTSSSVNTKGNSGSQSDGNSGSDSSSNADRPGQTTSQEPVTPTRPPADTGDDGNTGGGGNTGGETGGSTTGGETGGGTTPPAQ